MRPGVCWLLGLTLLLGLLTEVSFYPPLRFSPEGPELLRNPQFLNSAEGWTGNALKRGAELIEGGVLLRNLDRGGHFLSQELPVAAGSRLLISARVSSRGVIPGAKPWQLARINLLQRDAAGKVLPTRSGLAVALRGDNPWQERVAEQSIAEQARRVTLVVAMNKAEGEFRVRGLSVRQARVNSEFLWLGRITLVGWVFAGVMALVLLLRGSARPWVGLVLLLLTGAMLLLLMLPKEAPGSIPRLGLDLVAELRDRVLQPSGPGASAGTGPLQQQGPASEPLELAADKLGHGLLFGLLALLGRLLYPGIPLWRSALYLLGLALASEQLQHFTAARGAGLEDLWSDVLGIATGLLAAGTGLALARWLARALPGRLSRD